MFGKILSLPQKPVMTQQSLTGPPSQIFGSALNSPVIHDIYSKKKKSTRDVQIPGFLGGKKLRV